MKELKLFKGVEATPLQKLNEGKELAEKKYIFQGVFTQCSVPGHVVINRNNRSYPETQMLQHLSYLRDMIRESGCLLGELDHPEGRFDVQLKDASHKITDLWYDEKTHCVMGKLEVLDTPNGKTLKEIIDAGYPLYVSSRAAGDVNEKTREVEIAQIFTYDVVCTPGFKEAKLQRVNESLSAPALKFLNESFGSSDEAVETEITVDAKFINESAIAKFANTTMNDVNKPLNEDEDVSEKEKSKEEEKVEAQKEEYLPTPEMNPLKEDNDDEDKEESEKEDKEKKEEDNKEEKDEDKDNNEDKKDEENSDGLTDEEKEKNREAILNIVGLDVDGEPVGSSVEDKEDSEAEENKDDILDIEAVGNDEEDSDEDKESEDSDEDGETEEANESEETNEDEDANEACSKKTKLQEETDKDISELESILNSVSKAESVKESIIRRYPFAISLSESNFAKFASLRPKLKKRCAEFIEENEIYDIHAINELWMAPLQEEKRIQQNWLKLASQSDIDLYVAAPVEVQNAIEESAKYVILDTQEEVDAFWQRTGLRQAYAQKLMNEKRMSAYQQAINENREFQNNNPLGYSENYIKMTEQWLRDNF